MKFVLLLVFSLSGTVWAEAPNVRLWDKVYDNSSAAADTIYDISVNYTNGKSCLRVALADETHRFLIDKGAQLHVVTLHYASSVEQNQKSQNYINSIELTDCIPDTPCIITEVKCGG